MLIQYLVPLTAAFVVFALVFLVGALTARRRLQASHGRATELTTYLDERAAMLPIILSTARADLAERDAAIEHQLWTIGRFDTAVSETTARLRERRHALDSARVRLEASRNNVERLKSALRMIMRAIELRRTILG